MINPQFVVSASIAGNNSGISIPGPVNLTGSSNGPGGVDRFDYSNISSYSLQAFVTGSSLNGTLYLQQSNNMVGWLSALSQSVTVPGDYFFKVRGNNMSFGRLLWSGSAGSGSTVSVSEATFAQWP